MYKQSCSEFLKRFRINLTNELRRVGMSQRELVFAGLDPRYINRVKAGKTIPTLKSMWKICASTGIDPKDLIK